jgi:N-acyl-L-homoserine lactone synthetase
MKKGWLKKFLIDLYIYLNLKRPFKKYHIERVESDKVMKKIYKLRYDIYCKEVKLLSEKECKEEFEKDVFEDKSTHFVVLNKKNEVVGTVRLIKFSELGLPTIDEFDLHKQLEKIDKNKTLEISRFMVRKDYRKTMLMVDMCKAVYQYTKINNYNYMMGCAERWFIKSMNQLFGPLNIIGDPKFCFNAMNYPFILGVDEAERNGKAISMVLFKYFASRDSNIKT